MKKLLMAAVAVSGLATTPAFAATDATYTVTGSVAATCSITGTGTVAFGALTTGAGVFSNPTAAPFVDGNAYCNQSATTVAVTHVAMTADNTAAPATGFTKTVDFTPVLTFSGATVTGDTVSPQAIGSFSSLSVTASAPTPAGGLKLVAGAYSGSISVTLTPTS